MVGEEGEEEEERIEDFYLSILHHHCPFVSDKSKIYVHNPNI